MKKHHKQPRRRLQFHSEPEYPYPHHRTRLDTASGPAWVTTDSPLAPETREALITLIEVAIAAHKRKLLPPAEPDRYVGGLDESAGVVTVTVFDRQLQYFCHQEQRRTIGLRAVERRYLVERLCNEARRKFHSSITFHTSAA